MKCSGVERHLVQLHSCHGNCDLPPTTAVFAEGATCYPWQ